MPIKAIARTLGISRNTVRAALASEGCHGREPGRPTMGALLAVVFVLALADTPLSAAAAAGVGQGA
jgi:hypothetical protein